jgi:multiple sugar transport system permease protein
VRRSKIAPYLFISPQIILFAIFFAVPAITGIYVAFTDWNLFEAPVFTGFKNFYEILFNKDSTFYMQFHNGLWNTVQFVIYTVPICIIVPLLMAMALNTKLVAYKFFQSVYYLPSLLSISAVVLTWVFMFNKNNGLINNVFNLDVIWGGVSRGGGQQPYTWIALVILTVWWCIGGNLIIYMAALSGVSKDLVEAACIDGANSLQKFLHIIIPGIKNPLTYTFVLTTIAQFNIFGQPFMFSTGGPSESTYVLIMYIRTLAFGSGEPQAGLASAMSVMLGLCILVVSIFQYAFMREKEN